MLQSSENLFSLSGRTPLAVRAVAKYGTAAVVEDPIKPSVSIEHTKLLINGKFVDSASGEDFVF